MSTDTDGLLKFESNSDLLNLGGLLKLDILAWYTEILVKSTGVGGSLCRKTFWHRFSCPKTDFFNRDYSGTIK